MSVIVKGMKMPDSCEKCKLDLRTDACRAFDEWHKEHPYSIRARDRLPDCPLVELREEHLIEEIKKQINFKNRGSCDYQIVDNIENLIARYEAEMKNERTCEKYGDAEEL